MAATDVWSRGPLVLTAKVRFFQLKSGQLDMTYVLYWQDRGRWRSEWRGGDVSEIQGVGNGVFWTKTNLRVPSIRFLQFNQAMQRLTQPFWPDPFGTPMPAKIGESRAKHRKVNGTQAYCIESGVSKSTTNFSDCFDTEKGFPITAASELGVDITFSGYIEHSDAHFPTTINILERGRPIAEVKLQLKPWQPGPDSFDPPEDAAKTTLPKCEGPNQSVFGKLLRAPYPPYPMSARQRRVQGTVIVYSLVGVDGRTKNLTLLQPVSSELDSAVFETVRNWTYEPSTYCGVPIEVEFPIAVSFMLSPD